MSIRIIIGLAALNIATGWLWLHTHDKLQAEQLRAEQLDGKLAAQIEQMKYAAKVRREGEIHRAELRKAAHATDWGGVRVPVVVVDKLCEQADCAPR